MLHSLSPRPALLHHSAALFPWGHRTLQDLRTAPLETFAFLQKGSHKSITSMAWRAVNPACLSEKAGICSCYCWFSLNKSLLLSHVSFLQWILNGFQLDWSAECRSLIKAQLNCEVNYALTAVASINYSLDFQTVEAHITFLTKISGGKAELAFRETCVRQE